MNERNLRIGMIGLDTSHATAFAELLNNPLHPHHVPGGRVVVAYPGGSPDFELSCSRVDGFTRQLRDQYGVRIVDTPEAVAENSDAILLESVDGRVHLPLFERIARYGKPVFVDKPFALRSQEAEAIFCMAGEHGVAVMSCSSLRYAEGLTAVLADDRCGAIIGTDVYGPLSLQDTQPGLFWYGIHTVEMLMAAMGIGCVEVRAVSLEDHELIAGTWADGRIGTIRGNRKGNNQFGAVVHREQGSRFADVYAHDKPYYASLLERIMAMFRSGQPDIAQSETLHIVRFVEAANESRASGAIVKL